MALKSSIAILFISIFVLNLNAAEEKKGQRYYLKHCKECHGFGKRGGNLATMEDWDNYFKDGAKELKAMHEEQKKVQEYLNSKKFLQKESKRMLIFLKDFAKDSSKIQTCES
jgi:cytochrome c2